MHQDPIITYFIVGILFIIIIISYNIFSYYKFKKISLNKNLLKFKHKKISIKVYLFNLIICLLFISSFIMNIIFELKGHNIFGMQAKLLVSFLFFFNISFFILNTIYIGLSFYLFKNISFYIDKDNLKIYFYNEEIFLENLSLTELESTNQIRINFGLNSNDDLILNFDSLQNLKKFKKIFTN